MSSPATTTTSTTATTDKPEATSDSYYFDSYSHFGIHEEMLKDSVRTKAYQKAILNNKPMFKGKIVLDVGCGTGILSMFAAKAGAKHVYGIEFSEIAVQAQQIVKDNNLSDKVTIIKGKVEEVQLPVEKVDIIISEWMGYFLVYESMLGTVLDARDKWLAPGGAILPDKATMYLAGIEDAEYKEQKIHYWDNVYGFNYSAIKQIAMTEPLVDTVDNNQVITGAVPIKTYDIMTCTKEDLKFKADFALPVKGKSICHALISYFDTYFSLGHHQVNFSTGPHAKYTHWKQTVFYLEEDLAVNKGDVIKGSIDVRPNEKNHRDYDIDISIDFQSKEPSSPHVKLNTGYKLR